MKTAKEAFETLCRGINIKYYVGPNGHKLIQDACCEPHGEPEVADEPLQSEAEIDAALFEDDE